MSHIIIYKDWKVESRDELTEKVVCSILEHSIQYFYHVEAGKYDELK